MAVSHSRTVLSSDAEASLRPSGDHATLHTSFVCPFSVRTTSPVTASQMRSDPSQLAEARSRPSGRNATP